MSDKPKRKYKCDVCGQSLIVFVNPTTPPVHPCPKQSNRSVEYKEVK